MGSAKLPEKIDERRNDSASGSSLISRQQAPPTPEELLIMELKAEIARKNTELKKLLNGEEISDLRNKARIIYRRNAELEKENDKLKALVSNLKTKVIPELRNKLINKSDEKKIILKNKPITTVGTFLNNDQLSKIDLRKTSVVTKKTKSKKKKVINKKS